MTHLTKSKCLCLWPTDLAARITEVQLLYKPTHSFCFRLRSYHGECTGSRPLSEVKLRWAGVVLWWETTRERPVLQASFFFSLPFVLCCLFNSGLFLYSSNRAYACLSLTQSWICKYAVHSRPFSSEVEQACQYLFCSIWTSNYRSEQQNPFILILILWWFNCMCMYSLQTLSI